LWNRAITKRRVFSPKSAPTSKPWQKGLLEFETLTGDEIQDLLKGKKPNRESVLEPSTPRTSAVPPAGKPRPRPDPDAGLEPQPQA
jgi:cell division protease FtsH